MLRGASGRSKAVIAALLATTLAVVGTLAVGAGRHVAAGADQAEEDALMHRLLLLRGQWAWIHLDLEVDSLYAATQGTEPGVDRLEAFQQERSAVLDELQEIATSDSGPADAASELLEVFESDTFDEWPYPTLALDNEYLLSMERNLVGELFRHNPEVSAALQASMVPLLVTNDGLVVELSKRSDVPPDWMIEYYELTLDIVSSSPGWVGPDREEPLLDNYRTSDTDPSYLALLDGFATDELAIIWDYDQWLVAGADDGFATTPPVSIDELYQAERAATAIRTPIIEALTDADEEALARASSRAGLAPVLYGGGGASYLAAIVVVAALVLWQRRQRQHIAVAASTDPLTGAWNRRYFDNEAAGRYQRRGYHHVIAMIDLDRFKLVNDTHGHNAGDDLLVLVVQRLQAVAVELTEASVQADGEVVRLGGDEFVVALHHPDRFDVATVERLLRGVTGPVDIGLGELVDLDFSLGLAESFEPVDINDLLRIADLATYEDKRARSETRSAHEQSGSGNRLDLTRR